MRRSELLSWAASKSVSAVDVFAAYEADERPLTDLVNNVDGIHPLPAGSLIGRDCLITAFGRG